MKFCERRRERNEVLGKERERRERERGGGGGENKDENARARVKESETDGCVCVCVCWGKEKLLWSGDCEQLRTNIYSA